MQVHIRKAKVIDPQSGYHEKTVDLLIEDGIIKNIGGTVKSDAKTVIEAKGLCVSPGWVDAFADYREPGYEHKETIDSGLAIAASGGFTDVLLAPNTNPVLSNKSGIQYVLGKAAGHVSGIHPVGAATQNAEGKDLAEMMDMREYGAVAFSDGWKPVQSSGLMLKALEYVKAFNGTIMQLPVDASLASGGLMNEGVMSTELGMAGIPALAETLMIHRDIELVRYTNSKLHITGVSTAESVALVRKAKKEGLAVTCSVTPYHLALTDDMLSTYDSMFKVSPPLRSEKDRQALIKGVKDGTIDCISSHHRPNEWDAKAKEFEYASDGMAIQGITFAVLWDALSEYIDIERLMQMLTIIPRDIFGLGTKEIKKGAAACLTLFVPGGSTIVTGGPFGGKELGGRVVAVVNNNKVHINK